MQNPKEDPRKKGEEDQQSSKLDVISAYKKADFIIKIKCMYIRPCSLI
jgi:hypothetical protein